MNDLVPSVAAEITRQLRVVGEDIPTVTVGRHCEKPYPCPFKSRCWPVRAPHDVSELYQAGRKAENLRELGVHSVADVPDDTELSRIASRQCLAVKRGTMVVEPDLADALRALREPIAFLDFETIGPALPIWPGCSPFQAVPVQYSLHKLTADGAVTHHAYLAEGASDPRAQLADHLLAVTADSATVLAWAAKFEKQRILQLAADLPQRASELRALAGKLVDLLPIVRSNVYHPEFHGSFGLKSVGPALVPELAYTGLDIADGDTASTRLLSWLFDGESMPREAYEQLRTDLLAYCELDTLLLVRVLERVRGLAP